MKSSVFIYDPTITDKLSQVRGVGRYLQVLHENFENEFEFISQIENSKLEIRNSVFINPFFNFLQPPLTVRRMAQKQIAVIHDLIPLKYPEHFPVGLKGRLNIFLNKLAIKNYDVIITDSEASKKDIVDILNINEKKIRLVYPCLPKLFTNSELNLEPKIKNNSEFSILNSRFCLYVGDATWNKNLVNLAKAIKKINVTCVFVGRVFNPPTTQLIDSLANKWQEELKEFYDEIKDDKRFIFSGFVSDNDLLKLYQHSLLNILPSRDEGFGFSWLESASQRCPSVVSDIPIFHEITASSAVFCNTNSPDDLARAIEKPYFNSDLRNLWGQKAYERSRFFSAEKFKKDFHKALNI